MVRPALVLSAASSAMLALGSESQIAVYAGRLFTGLAAGVVFTSDTAWVKGLSAPTWSRRGRPSRGAFCDLRRGRGLRWRGADGGRTRPMAPVAHGAPLPAPHHAGSAHPHRDLEHPRGRCGGTGRAGCRTSKHPVVAADDGGRTSEIPPRGSPGESGGLRRRHCRLRRPASTGGRSGSRLCFPVQRPDHRADARRGRRRSASRGQIRPRPQRTGHSHGPDHSDRRALGRRRRSEPVCVLGGRPADFDLHALPAGRLALFRAGDEFVGVQVQSAALGVGERDAVLRTTRSASCEHGGSSR